MTEKTSLAARNQEQQLIQRLLQAPIFQRMAGKQVQVLIKLSRTVSVEEGEKVWEPGDECHAFRLLLKGELQVLRQGQEARRIEPINLAGEVALFTGEAHADQGVATKPSVLMEIPRESFDHVLKRSTDICQRLCRNVVGDLSERLQEANEKVSEVSRRRRELEEQIREAEWRLNDLNMIRRMRSG